MQVREQAWAVKLLQDMQTQGHTPNLILWNTVINGYAQKGDAAGALQLLDGMRAQGVAPDTVTMNTVINAHAQAGRAQDAMELLESMQAEGLTPDNFTINTIINAHVQAGDTAGAQVLGQKFREQGYVPDPVTLTSLQKLKAGSQRPSWVAPTIGELAEMTQQGMKPTVKMMNAAINARAKVGDCKGAMQLLRMMQEGGPRPDVVSLNSALKAHAMCKRVDVRAVQALLDQMTADGLRRDRYTYFHLLLACKKNRDRARAVAYFDQLTGDGMGNDTKLCQILSQTLGIKKYKQYMSSRHK